MIIYMILNLINGKMYIGKSQKDDITSNRSRPHKHLHGKGRYSKRVFSAVKHYGIENFLVILLHKEDCTNDKLAELEKYYISHFKTVHQNGYNMNGGGDGGDTWSTLPEEQKAEIRFKLSKPKSPETKKKLSAIATIVQKEVQNRPEQRKKNSEAQFIAQNKPETKKKIAEIKDSRTEEEKAEIIRRQVETNANKSEEEKKLITKKRLETMSNKSEEEKTKIRKKKQETWFIRQHTKQHTKQHADLGVINLYCSHCRELENEFNAC